MGDTKAKFEKERDEILKSLPEEVTKMFGIIGFIPGDEDEDEEEEGKQEPPQPYYQPVLIVSPFDVPPKPVRDIYWMDVYTKAKRSKAKLKQMDYLVYVYGSDDPDDCYNFVNQTDFISLEQGCSKGYDQLPSYIDSKVKSDTPTTDFETKIIRGLEEMKTDMTKQPIERKHGNPFLEKYEIELQKMAAKNNDGDDGKMGPGPATKKQKN